MKSDLEQFADLHAADERASKQGDYRTLRSLMSDDAVLLPPGGQLTCGRAANAVPPVRASLVLAVEKKGPSRSLGLQSRVLA